MEIKEKMIKEYPEESNNYFNSTVPHLHTLQENSEEVGDKNPPHPDIKKVYRILVSMLHPDKKPGVIGDIFPEIVKAYNQNKMGKILEAAFLLKIDLSFLNPEIIDILIEENTLLKKEVQNLHKTAGFQWLKDPSEVSRQNIIEHIFNTRGVSINNEKKN